MGRGTMECILQAQQILGHQGLLEHQISVILPGLPFFGRWNMPYSDFCLRCSFILATSSSSSTQESTSLVNASDDISAPSRKRSSAPHG